MTLHYHSGVRSEQLSSTQNMGSLSDPVKAKVEIREWFRIHSQNMKRKRGTRRSSQSSFFTGLKMVYVVLMWGLEALSKGHKQHRLKTEIRVKQWGVCETNAAAASHIFISVRALDLWQPQDPDGINTPLYYNWSVAWFLHCFVIPFSVHHQFNTFFSFFTSRFLNVVKTASVLTHGALKRGVMRMESV